MPQGFTEPGSRALPGEGASPVKVLVVEDEPLVRFTLAEELRGLDVSVIEAATADEAWQYLTNGAYVDLVFTDIQMPGSMNGLQFAARLRDEYPAIKVIVTSSTIDAHEPFTPFVRKPYPFTGTAIALAKCAKESRQERSP
jgi:two-component system, response regulator PdtaR